jgi:hypothetical protein
VTEILSSPHLSRSQSTVRYSLDEPSGDGPFRFPIGSEIVIMGWAFLEPAGSVPLTELEVLNVRTGTIARFDTERRPRPDVARHFGIESVQMAGFASTFHVDSRFNGDNRVRLVHMDDCHVAHSCDLFSFSTAPATYEIHARRDLAARFLRGRGLEIGALQRPLDVPAGCSVTYVDRMPLHDLLTHYPELHGQPIQKPDLIDDGETLATIGSCSHDFVIANHFLEHCENPIQTILTFMRVLKDDGILYMAVPDKRLTFDIDRPITAYAVLAETFRCGHRHDREELYCEWAALVSRVSPSDVISIARKLSRDRYSIHFNVWSLPDLLHFLMTSRIEFHLPFSVEWLVCSENEVIIILKKTEGAPGAP